MSIVAALLITALGDPVELTVTSDLGELDEAVRQQVTTRVESAASALDHPVVEGADHQLSIAIGWAEGSKTDFTVTLRASDGESATAPHTFDCKECSATELLDHMEEHSRAALQDLFESEQAPAEEPPPPAASPPPDRVAPSPSRPGLGRLGWAGVGSLGIGVTSTAVGAALASLGQARLKSDPTSLRDFRPAGYVSLGVGGVGLVAGAVLLILDRRHARSEAQAWRLSPDATGLHMYF